MTPNLIAVISRGEWFGSLGLQLLLGVLAGVIAAALVMSWQTGRRRKWESDHYAPLTGTWERRRKLTGELLDGQAVTTVEGNVVTVSFAGLPGEDAVDGEIVLRRDLPRRGAGHYRHEKDSQLLWGFWDVTVDADHGRMFVHNSYVRAESGEPVYQAMVWEKVPS